MEFAVIEFSLDGRSGVSPYLQVVQQVRQALRLGPAARGRPAADRQGRGGPAGDQPQHGAQGLPRAGARRAGRGPAGRRHVRHPDADRRLARRARAAAQGPRSAGWPRPGWPGSTTRASRRCSRAPFAPRSEEHSVTAVLRADGPGQALPPPVGARGLHPRDPGRSCHRPGRSQRRRQDHAAQPGRRAARADRRHDRGVRRPAGRRRGAARQGRLRRAGHPDVRRSQRRRPPAARRPAQPALGRRRGPRRGSRGSASTRRSGPAGCPAASAPSSRSPSAWPSDRSC